MVKIKDVAIEAGVSVGTVSKVLHNAYVKPENRIRVEEAISRLNYHVNTYAQGLRASQTFTIAIIVPDLINPFFALLVNYVEQVLASYGYRLLVCNSHCHADREYSYIKMVTQNKVDGLIAVTYSNTDMYKKAGIPIVSIDRTFDDNSCCVSSDNEMGGRLAAEKFIQTGCHHVVYIRNGSKLEGETLKRGASFMKTCKDAGIEATTMDFGEETTLDSEKIEEINSFLEQSVQEGKLIYDGIFTSSDVHAIVVKRKLEQLKMKVPNDVQIIGYDGIRILNFGDYAVSGIAQPVNDMAVICVDNLIKQIEKQPYERKIVLPVKFVEGGTTR